MELIDISVALSKDLPTWPGVWQYQVEWDGKDNGGRASAAGLYMYRLEADGLVNQKKMTLLK